MAGVVLKSYLKEMRGFHDDAVFYTWGGKVYMRRYVIPHNPRSEAQQAHRSLFAEGMAAWKLLEEAEKQKYRKLASGTPLHGHNIFISRYIDMCKQESETAIESPAIAEPAVQESDMIDTGGTCTPSVAPLYGVVLLPAFIDATQNISLTEVSSPRTPGGGKGKQ